MSVAYEPDAPLHPVAEAWLDSAEPVRPFIRPQFTSRRPVTAESRELDAEHQAAKRARAARQRSERRRLRARRMVG